MTHKTLSDATTLSRSEPGSDGNERVHHIPQSSCITWALPLDSLVSYSGHSLVVVGGSYLSEEVQSVYSVAVADWDEQLQFINRYIHNKSPWNLVLSKSIHKGVIQRQRRKNIFFTLLKDSHCITYCPKQRVWVSTFMVKTHDMNFEYTTQTNLTCSRIFVSKIIPFSSSIL